MIGKDFRIYDPDRRISYGKHVGKKYRDVPTDYLKWVAREGFGKNATRRLWAELELERRNQHDCSHVSA